MAKTLYQDDNQILFEISELPGGGKRYEIHINLKNHENLKDEPGLVKIIPVFASKKSHIPKMPIITWDTIVWPCCSLENMWILDADKQFWIRLGADRWDKTNADYLLWLLADVFKMQRNKVREAGELELEK